MPGWIIDQQTGRLITTYGPCPVYQPRPIDFVAEGDSRGCITGLDLGGNSIQNVSAIIGQNWKIDGHGKITAKELCLDDVCIARDQLKALLEKNQIDSFAPAP